MNNDSQAERRQAAQDATVSDKRDSLQVGAPPLAQSLCQSQVLARSQACVHLQSRPSEQEQLPREEVIRRLRLLAKPVTLFGEARPAAAAAAAV